MGCRRLATTLPVVGTMSSPSYRSHKKSGVNMLTRQHAKKRQKSSAASAYISVSNPWGTLFAVEISFRPPYYQDGSNLRVFVNPQLVVSPAICRRGKYHLI